MSFSFHGDFKAVDSVGVNFLAMPEPAKKSKCQKRMERKKRALERTENPNDNVITNFCKSAQKAAPSPMMLAWGLLLQLTLLAKN